MFHVGKSFSSLSKFSRVNPSPQASAPPRNDGGSSVTSHTRYFVIHDRDVWLIKFDDEQYGPYPTQREAMLFAIDAAYSLGEIGENTQVCLMSENGYSQPAWTYGQDKYPSGL
jgi:hypothetical protein